MKRLTPDPELEAIPAVLAALSPLNQDAQRRVLDYSYSRLQLSDQFRRYGGPGDYAPAPMVAVGGTAGGSGSPLLDIFSMIGMALSAVGGARFVFEGIKLWLDRKKGRKLKFVKEDFQLEIEGDVSADEIELGFEQFKRLRNELSGEQILVLEPPLDGHKSKPRKPTAKRESGA